MTTKILQVCLALLCVLALGLTRPERRGSCLMLCGDFNGVGCPSGYACQSNGCGSECYNATFIQPLGCPPFDCDQHCPLGYKRDHNGCQHCTCDYSAIAIGK